jgi:hypothetical protein
MTRLPVGPLLLVAAFSFGTVRWSAAQDRGAVQLEPSYRSWSFRTPVPNESLTVKRASQFALPIGATVRAGRLTVDASAAYSVGRVGLEGAPALELSGLTDVRLRGVFRVVGDNLLITAGVTAPVGADRLSGQELQAIGVIGATALGFGVPTLGNGFGATGGVVLAWRAGGWGLGFATAVEARGRYTPIEALIAGVRSPTDLEPGNAVRFSLGADRLVGRGRVSFLVATDFYGESRLLVNRASGSGLASTYQLGPQFAGSASFDLGVRGFRTFTITLADRYRTRFTGFDGKKAAGSSGNIFDGALEFVTGAPRSTGFFLRADTRLDSGLEVDNSITTASMTSGGLSVGLMAPVGRLTLQPFVRGQAGKLDTGPASSTAIGWGFGLAMVLR